MEINIELVFHTSLLGCLAPFKRITVKHIENVGNHIQIQFCNPDVMILVFKCFQILQI